MAFTPFSANVKNLENLGTDKPNADLGLTGLQLRQRFDKAVSDLKSWVNDTFLTEISGIYGAGNIGITQISGMDATNVQAGLAELYSKRGEVQDGSITVGKLSGSFALPAEKIAGGAVTKEKIASGATYTTTSISLSSSGWSNRQQTVNIGAVTAGNCVIVSPAPSSFTEYGNAGVRATAQGAGTLTFTCNTVPGGALNVNVVILT